MSIHYTIKKRIMRCRVVGGARAVDDQTECLPDQMLGRYFLGWKVDEPLRGYAPFFFNMIAQII